MPWLAAALLAIVAGAGWLIAWRATRTEARPLIRFSVDLGPDAVPGLNLTAAISPDGRRLVFPARGPNGIQQLATRLLGEAQVTLLTGTEGGSYPFFSPDGQSIGFVARNQLKRISVLGGAPVTLASGANVVSGSWGEDGNMIVGWQSLFPLSRLRDSGGIGQPVTRLGAGETTHRWPQVLPGDDAVLFTASASSTAMDNANIEVISLKTGQVKILQRGGYYGRYLPSGHLVFVHQGVLFGRRFNLARLEAQGAPTPLLQDIAANAITGGGQFDFSSTGIFVYAAGKSAAQTWQVDWLDQSGKLQPLLPEPGAYSNPRFSPDGQKLAFVSNTSDIYIRDLDRDTTTRLTFTGGALLPIWAPDSRHILFSSGSAIFWMRSDGSEDPQRVLQGTGLPRAWSISPDGRVAIFDKSAESGFDLWTLPLDLADPDHPKPGKLELFLRTQADEMVPRFSPDGRWIAYRSNETGTPELYVRPFPAASGGKWQISAGGAIYGLWSNKGRELFYETPDNRIMVVNYAVEGASFVPGTPRLWSDKQLFSTGTSSLDLAPDGKRFAVFWLPESTAGQKGSVHVTVLLNFFDELKRRIP
jgi:Tol biopolymer transport system component